MRHISRCAVVLYLVAAGTAFAQTLTASAGTADEPPPAGDGGLHLGRLKG